MAQAIYVLCALTCAACFILLLRSWLSTRHRLLFWSALSFGGLTLANALLVVDKIALPQEDLSILRLVVALGSLLLLVFGLVWTEEEA